MSNTPLNDDRGMAKSTVVVLPELLPVPAVKGGAVEHWVDEICKRMAKEGRRLAVVSRPAGVPGVAGVDYIGIPWTASERWFARLKDSVSWRNPLRYLAKMQVVAAYGRRVAVSVREFDVIYVQNEPNLLLFIRKKKGQRLILHMHNDHLTMPLFRPLYRRLLAKADRVLFVSDYVRRRAVTYFPEHGHRFKVVFNATDPDVFQPYGPPGRAELASTVAIAEGRPHVLYVGRLVPIKGVHILIEAFTEVLRRVPSARLVVTGSSFFAGASRTPYEQRLEEMARPIQSSIVFTGFLPHEKLRYLYSSVDVVALPSVWQDPCPLVTLEAMATRTCLVSTAVGGIPELVSDGVDGVLVAPGDANALAAAISGLLEDPARRGAMGEAARRKVLEGYRWERLVAEVETELQSL